MPLQEKPFQLLAALLERPQEILTREEAIQRLWPDGTIVDFEHSLATAVNKIRSVLDDTAQDPRYLETLPKRGYRFICPVEPEFAGDEKEESKAGPPRRRNFLPGLAVGLIAAAVIYGGVMLLSKPEPPRAAKQPAASYRFRQITRDVGLTFQPALSADGKLLAYVSDRAGGGKLDLWVQHVNGADPIRLTFGPDDVGYPSFSPDGSQIAFCSDKDGRGVYIVPALGGEARRLADLDVNSDYPAFSPDGSLVAFSRGVPGESSIYTVSSGGGQPQKFTTDIPYVRHPLWSPDGNWLLFEGNADSTGVELSTADLWAAPTGGGNAVRTGVFDALRLAGIAPRGEFGVPFTEHARWTLVGNHILLSARSGGVDSIWRVPVSTLTWKVDGHPERLTSGSSESSPSAAASGGFAFEHSRMRSNIWSLPIRMNNGEPTGLLERITAGDQFDSYPTVSEDGTILVFTSNRSGNRDVWILDLTTGKEIQLTFTPVDENRAAISPDGSRIVFRRIEGTSQRLYLLGLPGGPEKLLCEDCPGLLSWTPDSRKVIYYWGEPARSATIDVNTREKTDIVSYPGESASVARFSPDGAWLSFYVASRGILIAPVRGGIAAGSGEWFPLSDYLRQRVSWWSPDGNLLYTLSDQDGYSCIWKQRLDPATKRARGSPEAILHMHGWRSRLPPAAPGYGLAAGRLYIQVMELDGNVWLAEPRNGGS